jgi:hypothetical protein
MGIQISGTTNTISPTSNALKFLAIAASEYVNALANTGATPTIDLSLGNFVTATLNQNATFTFSNAPSQACSFTLVLTNDAVGGRTITWPASVKWPNGTAPTRTSTASRTDIYTFFTYDSGTTWWGQLSMYNYS